MSFTKCTPDVTPQTQLTKAACWYACFRMLFQWKRDKGDSSKNPDAILGMLDKSPNLYPYMMKDSWGIDAGECREAARYLGLQASGDGEIDAGALENTIKSRGPVWVAGDWGSGNHVIVVTACEASTGKIKYINPYKNDFGTDSNGTISWLNGRGSLWKNCDASIMCW